MKDKVLSLFRRIDSKLISINRSKTTLCERSLNLAAQQLLGRDCLPHRSTKITSGQHCLLALSGRLLLVGRKNLCLCQSIIDSH